MAWFCWLVLLQLLIHIYSTLFWYGCGTRVVFMCCDSFLCCFAWLPVPLFAFASSRSNVSYHLHYLQPPVKVFLAKSEHCVLFTCCCWCHHSSVQWWSPRSLIFAILLLSQLSYLTLSGWYLTLHVLKMLTLSHPVSLECTVKVTLLESAAVKILTGLLGCFCVYCYIWYPSTYGVEGSCFLRNEGLNVWLFFLGVLSHV